ncbi:MAG: hypothetical protein PVI49_10480 [Desulfobacterales bacterium]|jgi:hypothetical protein
MIIFNRYLFGVICGIILFGMPSAGSADPPESITEAECARLSDAEIIWDLSKYRWLCCIPKSEDEYEACLPISDMRPLPKTSVKPFPPKETRTIKQSPQKQ